jgi:hypothetical protein
VNPTLIKAVVVVTFALLFYSTAVVIEQRKSLISKRVLFLLTGGVCLDIASTVLMISGSGKTPPDGSRRYWLHRTPGDAGRHSADLEMLDPKRRWLSSTSEPRHLHQNRLRLVGGSLHCRCHYFRNAEELTQSPRG